MAGGDGNSFDEEKHRVWAEAVAIQADTAGEIDRLLTETKRRIDEMLAGQPTEWQHWYLPRLRQEVGRVMEEFGADAGAAMVDGAAESWNKGVELIDAPVATGGIDLTVLTPHLDRAQLLAQQHFLTSKMRSVSGAVANRINTELGLVVTGLNTPSQAATGIQGILDGAARSRSLTIVRTELGRAFSTAGQGRMEQAITAGVKGLKKQWRRSGKIHSRLTHDLADGQIQPVDKPFLVGGEPLMYPRDPNGSAKNTVNCGCASLPYMDRWEMSHPGEVPISPAERAANRAKRLVDEARTEGFKTWAQGVLSGNRQPQGEWQTVGTLSADALAELRRQGIEPATMEIAVSDKMLRRPRRPKKQTWNKALPDELLEEMPALLDQPKAVLYGVDDNSLHYVFDIPGETRLGQFVVRVHASDARSRLKKHNYVVSGGRIERDQLVRAGKFVPISGVV